MTATLAASAAILKTRYPNGELPKELYQNNTFHGLIPKATDFDGNNRVVAIQTEYTQGASADFATALGALQQSKYSNFLVTRVEDFSLARIKGQALRAAQKDTGALVDLWENEMKSANMSATRSLAIMEHRDGTGTRGQIASGSTTTTITLTSADSDPSTDVTNFAVGMSLQFSATAGSALRSAGAKAVITAIDRANATLTFGSALNVLLPDIGATDFIYRAGDENAVITGINGWIPGGSSPGTLFGLNRNTDPVRLAGQSYNATGVPMGDALIEAAARVGVEGGMPDVVIAHPRDVANFKKTLDGKVQYNRVESDVAGVSFRSIEFEGDNGVIKVLSDMNRPKRNPVLLQTSSWRLHSLGPAPGILDYDNNQFLRVASDDAYEVRVGSYVAQYCNEPAFQIQLTNWGV